MLVFSASRASCEARGLGLMHPSPSASAQRAKGFLPIHASRVFHACRRFPQFPPGPSIKTCAASIRGSPKSPRKKLKNSPCPRLTRTHVMCMFVPMVRVQHLFPAPMVAELKRIAGILDRTVSEIVREAVRAWIDAWKRRNEEAR